MAELIHAVGSRKRATARVWIREGRGLFFINGKDPKEYLKREDLVQKVFKPLEITQTKGKIDVKIKAKGGGLSGQADAIALGIARALTEMNPEYKDVLKNEGLLTRDPREKERMKYGKAKRRRSFQWTKR